MFVWLFKVGFHFSSPVSSWWFCGWSANKWWKEGANAIGISANEMVVFSVEPSISKKFIELSDSVSQCWL